MIRVRVFSNHWKCERKKENNLRHVSYKSCLAGQQGFHLNKLHKLVFNCHVQRIRRMIIRIRYIDSNDILVVL